MDGRAFLEQVAVSAHKAGEKFSPETISNLVQTEWARAIVLMALVLLTIWIIALVYSGYMPDSEIGPVALRAHVNRRQGQDTIVFDKDYMKIHMDGVEARCRIAYVYDDYRGRRKKIWLTPYASLQLHVRASKLPNRFTYFGHEIDEQMRSCPQAAVVYPTIDIGPEPPQRIEKTPENIGDYVDKYDLIPKWTDDDDARVVSVGDRLLQDILEGRKEFLIGKIESYKKSIERKGLVGRLGLAPAARARANIFGSYFVRLEFSRNPFFVLFRHPNAELKMTAWLTVLTSIFALAMDAWPVKNTDSNASAGQIQSLAAESVKRPP